MANNHYVSCDDCGTSWPGQLGEGCPTCPDGKAINCHTGQDCCPESFRCCPEDGTYCVHALPGGVAA